MQPTSHNQSLPAFAAALAIPDLGLAVHWMQKVTI
jgi:hypothetical protein